MNDGTRLVRADTRADLERLEKLLRDLRRIADGRGPTAEELEAAPLLDRWRLLAAPHACLAGAPHGHPDLLGPLTITSPVWALAPDLGWARTLSRFYRLGRPDGVADAS